MKLLRLALGFVVLFAAAPAVGAPISMQLVEPSAPGTTPQVFVRDPAAPEVTDDRGVLSIAGFRRVRPSDEPGAELFTAEGAPLLFTLDKWRSANATVDVVSDQSGPRAVFTAHRLIAFGRYSLFLRTSADGTTNYTPLGAATANSFTADQAGNASLSVLVVGVPPNAQLVLIYHSDGVDHGLSPGDFGRTAHQQLIVIRASS